MDTNNSRAPNPKVKIVRQIIHLSRQHFQLCSSHLEETGIGSGQVPVLLELERHGELSQRELAERTRVTPATMSGTLKRMEKAGLITRTADENDARISRVQLTQAGHAQCDNAHRGFDMACEQLLSTLDDADIEALGSLLGRIEDALPPASCTRRSPSSPSDGDEA